MLAVTRTSTLLSRYSKTAFPAATSSLSQWRSSLEASNRTYASASTPLSILVPCKRVIDYAVKISIPGGSAPWVQTASVKHSLNPFDEIAVEEAVRLRQKHKDGIKEIIAISIGPKECQDTLRTALAMGADRAIWVDVGKRKDKDVQPLTVAKVLRKVVETEGCKLVIAGKQAIDDDSAQTGQLLAGFLEWPQATFASKLDIDLSSGKMTVEREVDGGIETISTTVPAVITTDLRLNEPRFATLPNIMKAKKKPLKKMDLESDLGLEAGKDLDPRLEIESVRDPPVRKAGIMVESVDDLVNKLKNEAKVI